MSERIRKLARQATGASTIYMLEEEWMKFAELIIRECDQYVADRYDESEPWMQPGDLLEHFGVK